MRGSHDRHLRHFEHGAPAGLRDSKGLIHRSTPDDPLRNRSKQPVSDNRAHPTSSWEAGDSTQVNVSGRRIEAVCSPRLPALQSVLARGSTFGNRFLMSPDASSPWTVHPAALRALKFMPSVKTGIDS